MTDVVIVSAVRTALGRLGGALKDVQPEDLAQVVIAAAVERAGVEPAEVDEVVMGQTKQSADAANLARVAALKAGFPVEVPAYTVMRQCGSGLQAVGNALQAIRAGDAEIVVAGGVESMSLAPYYLRGARFGFRLGNSVLVDPNTESQPRSQPHEVYGDLTMGLTAENLVERYGITREEQDAFALRSQERAFAAIDAGRFDDEIVPVPVPAGKGAATVFAVDEYPRHTSLEQLAALRAVLQGRRQRHPRQLVRPQRRRRLPGADVGGGRAGARRRAARDHPRPRGRRRRPAVHGHRARPRLARGARAGRPDPRGHRPRRDQRGVRRADDRLRARAGPRRGDPQRERRRHRPRAPPGLLRRPHPHHPASTRCASVARATGWPASASPAARAWPRSSRPPGSREAHPT